MPETRLVDTNRFVVRTSEFLRDKDRYYPEQPFWLFRDPSVPIPTLSVWDTLILLQRLVRLPSIRRITVTCMTSDLEARLRAAAPKERTLDSFLTEGAGP